MTLQQEQGTRVTPVAARREPVALALLQAMRPHQWTKNLFVFAALIFGRQMTNETAVLRSGGAFLIFCLLSSAVYLLNDTVDAEKDRQHPTKRLRPIAAGHLSPATAVVAAVVLAAMAIGASLRLPEAVTLVAVGYLAANLLYSFAAKHIVILDVMSIAVFFTLRAWAGAAAASVVMSHWLLICTILLALFIALSKRRHELVLLENGAANHRASLSHYSSYLLDQMIGVVTASTLMAYILYTVDARTIHEFGSDRLVYTVPCVLFGIFRYLYLVHQKGEGGSPDRILVSDRPFLANLLVWLAAVALIIYFR